MYRFQFFVCYISLILAGVKYAYSQEPAATFAEERLYGKMLEMDFKMQKTLEKLDKMEDDRDAQKDVISSWTTSGPKGLLVEDLERNGWEMVFRATSANGKNVYNAWSTGADTCVDKPSSMMRSHGNHYRNSKISNWANVGVRYVKYAYYELNQEVAYVIFNATGSDVNSWFDKNRIISSSYSDLTAADSFNIFSIAGDYRPGELERRFLINRVFGGCDGDIGHLVISDNEPPNACNWDKHVKYPQFLYSKINAADIWNQRMFGRADYMAIFVKTD